MHRVRAVLGLVVAMVVAQSVAAQQLVPGVWYGHFASRNGESLDERFEIELVSGELTVFAAPYGKTPASRGPVSTGADASARFRWANTAGAVCTLRPTAQRDFEGDCIRPGQDPWKLTLSRTEPSHGKDLAVSVTDLQILARARQILSGPSVWNRQDERACEDDVLLNSWSIFCALYQASLDVAGAYIHRRPVTTEARAVIADITKGQRFAHPIRDYNNLPSTSFDDVVMIFDRIQNRLVARMSALRK